MSAISDLRLALVSSPSASYKVVWRCWALVAGKQKIALPADSSITGIVGIGPNSSGGFALAAKLEISVPGLPKEQVQKLVEVAHQVCPYSNATRGNVEVELVVV